MSYHEAIKFFESKGFTRNHTAYGCDMKKGETVIQLDENDLTGCLIRGEVERMFDFDEKENIL